MQIIEVTDNIIVANFMDNKRSKINDAPQTINTICIALPDSLVFVDCGVYTKAIGEFRKQMEKRFNRKTSHLLLTHIHWDHILAMGAFKDVDVVISRKGISGLKRSYQGYLSAKKRKEIAENYKEEDPEIAADIENAELFVPNITVKDELILGEGKKELIFNVIGCHSSESACVYVPSEKILCTGDNLIECYPQLIKSSYDTIEMYRTWENMDVEHFIPGHGMPVKKSYISKVRSYYEELVEFLKNQIRQKITIEKVLKNPELPKYFGIGRKDWLYGCRPDSNWLQSDIKSWYRFLRK